MVRSKNKIYIGSSIEGYMNDHLMTVIFEYLTTHEIYDKQKPNQEK